MDDSFHDFFLASAGVAGALIGLLFVAISIALDRVLGPEVAQAHRIRASTALTTFTNALGISLFTLVPGLHAGWTATIVSILGLTFVAGSLISVFRVREEQPTALREVSFLLGVVVVFALQLYFGLRLIHDHGDTDALQAVCILVIVCFLVGISRSWELVGGPTIGLRSQIIGSVREHRHRDDEPG